MPFFKDLLKGERKSPRRNQSNVHQVPVAEGTTPQRPAVPTETGTIDANTAPSETTTPLPADANSATSMPAENVVAPSSEEEPDVSTETAAVATTESSASAGDAVPTGDGLEAETTAATEAPSTSVQPGSVTTVYYAEESSTASPRKKVKRKMTKEEAAEVYMYGPREEDIWTVPSRDERPTADEDDTNFRSNRAQSMRQSYIAKVTEDRIAFAKAKANLDSASQELPADTERRRREERKRRKLLKHYLTTSIPDDATTLVMESSTIAPTEFISTVTGLEENSNISPAEGITVSPTTESISSESSDESESSFESDSTSTTDRIARKIPRAIYTQPKIAVRETMSSKFRYLYNRKPIGVLVYFRSATNTQRKKPPFVTAVPYLCSH